MLRYLPLLILTLTLSACTPSAKRYDYPDPVDTRTREITYQKQQTYTYTADGLTVDNTFDGARLSNFIKLNDTLYKVIIEPENAPINPSAWYAFRLKSVRERTLTLRMSYPQAYHRYWPKVSADRKTWTPVDSSMVIETPGDSTGVDIRLDLPAGATVWLAAQEIINSQDVANWCARIAEHPAVQYQNIGKSRLGRPIPLLDMYEGSPTGKPLLVFLSRQHPPEVTGFMCMQSFLDELLTHERSSELLTTFRVMVFPLLNPDGVDLGHWRHNAGGIDLNRDWAYYRQPETRQVANYIVRQSRKDNNTVQLGIDFHSTWYDVYYTLREDQGQSILPHFKNNWLRGIEAEIGGGFEVNEKPGVISRPISARWFYTQFGAEGITYEIGDSTPRDFIDEKGRASARALLSELLP